MDREVILDNIHAPTHLIAHPRTKELYIADQPGYIYHEKDLWLDLHDRIIPLDPDYDESGLLSIAFSPDGEQLFLFSSRPVNLLPQDALLLTPKNINKESPDLHVDVISILPMEHPENEVILFVILRDLRYHHGGKMAFGPDGYLYITTGDGGPQEDPYGRAQDPSDPLGKVLRIKPKLGSYPEIYALGFRNPWSLTLSPDGRFFIGDVGHQGWEEINILRKDGNYGWNIKEGSNFTPWTKTRLGDFIDPIFEYPHRPGVSTAVMGGYYIPKGKKYPEGYYFADMLGPIMRLVNDKGHWYLSDVWPLQDENKPHLFIYGWGYDGDNLYLLMKGKVEKIKALIRS